MLKTKVIVRQADGNTREVEISDGGKVSLGAHEQLVIAAAPEQAEVKTEGQGKIAVRLEGVGEFTVESNGEPPEIVAMNLDEAPAFRAQPTIVFERVGAGGENDAVTHEPLGVHQASVGDTGFLDQRVGEDFGMGQTLDMASFSAKAGGELPLTRVVSDPELLGMADFNSVSSNPAALNEPPVIVLNETLLVPDGQSPSLNGSLKSVDDRTPATELSYFVQQAPVHGELLLDGVAITNFSKAAFTQADIDSGRVSFRFDTSTPGTSIQVLENDHFLFKVSDGQLSAEAVFNLDAELPQILGTDGSDDLTTATDFSRTGVSFHVYGFDGDDTLRGGAGADTLDGGSNTVGEAVKYHNYADTFSPVIRYEATPGGDWADYGASGEAVHVDLTSSGAQSGGHAEGDVLTGIENVIGSAHGDTLIGQDYVSNVFAGLAGADSLVGGESVLNVIIDAQWDFRTNYYYPDTADYSLSPSWVNVDLNTAGGQAGGGAGNHALGDTLVGIENVIGTNDAHGDALTGDGSHNFLDGLAGADTLIGGAGDDTLRGGSGADYLDGGTNTQWERHFNYGDWVDYSTSTAGVSVNLYHQDGTATQSGGDAEGDTLLGFENAMGSEHDDSLVGDDASNWLAGLDGNDTMIGDTAVVSGNYSHDSMWGGAGDDLMYGGAGNDQMWGDSGDDRLTGGLGKDSLYGGDGDDILHGSVSLNNFNTNFNDDAITGVDNTAPLFTAAYDDSGDFLSGGAGRDTLDGGGGLLGRETLEGGADGDMLLGFGTGGGNNLAYYENSPIRIYLDLDKQDGSGQIDPDGLVSEATGDTLLGIQHVQATRFDDTVLGSSEDNEIFGGEGSDFITGGEGQDSLWGDGKGDWRNWGNDTLEGGAGADYLNGSEGGMDIASYRNSAQGVRVDLDDQNYATPGPPNPRFPGQGAPGQVGASPTGEEHGDWLWNIDGLWGSEHGDTLLGRNDGWTPMPQAFIDHPEFMMPGYPDYDDQLWGFGGDDSLNGGDGDDSLYGGDGDDTLVGAAGADILDGGDGFDKADYSASPTWVNIDLSVTGAQTGGGADNHGLGDTLTGIEHVVGTNDTLHGDVLTGNDADNILDGLSGHDTLDGGGGNDTLYGREGFDVLYGSDGDDLLQGQGGNDTLYGGAGDDALVGGDGRDVLYGGEGNDSLVGGNTTDPASSIPIWDTLNGGAGADVLTGYGLGEVADYAGSLAVEIDLNNVIQVQGNGAAGNDAIGDELHDILNVSGSSFADTLIGNEHDNYFWGQQGDDLLIGGAGADSLRGDEGDDILEGGAGGDVLFGGAGHDIASYRNAAAGVLVDMNDQNKEPLLYPDGQAGAGVDGEEHGDHLFYIDGVWGSDHGDTLLGRDTNWDGQYNMSSNDELHGFGGDDSLKGLGGDDSLYGGDGHDTLFGDAGADILYGGDGNDSLDGFVGNDSLYGGDGNDTLIGWKYDLTETNMNRDSGIDLLDGGAGDDSLIGGPEDIVHGGEGFDVFVLEAEDLGFSHTLNLSAMVSEGHISGIEKINLCGVNGWEENVLTLKASDVLAVSDTDTLWVFGEGPAEVAATDSGWSLVEMNVVGSDGFDYNHYTNTVGTSVVHLMVAEDIATQHVVPFA